MSGWFYFSLTPQISCYEFELIGVKCSNRDLLESAVIEELTTKTGHLKSYLNFEFLRFGKFI